MAEQAQEPVATIESLQAELDAERTAHQATKSERDTALEDKDDLANALAGSQTALGEATRIIEGQKATIAEQEAKIIALQTTPAEFATITVDKQEYEVRAKSFQYKKVTYTVEQLLKNKSLQKELVKLGVGYIVKKEA